MAIIACDLFGFVFCVVVCPVLQSHSARSRERMTTRIGHDWRRQRWNKTSALLTNSRASLTAFRALAFEKSPKP